MTLLAGWSALLSRLSGQSDVVIGTPVANRPRREFEPLIGYFANMLALRVPLEADPSVAELLTQIRASTLDAYTHQDTPFAQVVEALQPARSLGYNPIFQVVLAFNNTPGERVLRLPGLKVTACEPPQTRAKFDLTLALRDDGQSIEGYLEYATDLFEHSSIERLGGQLLSLLEAMVADDRQHISELGLLSVAQRQQLLVQFNQHRGALSGRVRPASTLRCAGSADPGCARHRAPGLATDLCRAAITSQPAGAAAAIARHRTRRSGGDRAGAFDRAGDRGTGHPQMRRRLCAAGSECAGPSARASCSRTAAPGSC